jgi:hypothetical protein
VLSNQPQGGFITREHSSDSFVANDDGWSDDGFGFFFGRDWDSRRGNTRQRERERYREWERGRERERDYYQPRRQPWPWW